MAKGATEAAVLGSGLRVRGRVHGDGDLRIEAHVEGDVTVSGALELAEGAEVRGGVSARTITIAGALEGDVASRGEVVITATGSLRGDIEASGLVLEEGGNFQGTIASDFELPDAIA